MAEMTMSELEAIAGKHTTRQASEVKSNWRAIVKEAKQRDVMVTNYNRPEAVVMSAERYAELMKSVRENDPMKKLREEWDRKLAWMNEPGGREILDEWFHMTPEQIADAVNADVKKK